ncbi:exonuclease 1-like [Chenopodium quinoa]|uniref:exonuclease 1-like n=1 Tax=Chenopodium quinoa TaxID=63459 RepID=UPI000B78972D|nr:exonuclease 1-like [Chenopodium quinoa]
MGIQGLLPQLKSIMSPLHIKDLQGCWVAIDTYSWLHKGALSCSTQLCKGIPTSRHIDYCMHRVNLLRHYGVKPILVFDGGDLPMKGEQENKRARSRKENLERAIEHESSGNSAAAYECYQKAVDISPAIAHELIQVLKRESVCYIVAPYEADAQMTFLAITKQVDAVITEDSDLIAFGCPRIIYKMDKYGQGIEFQYHKLQYNKDLNFAGFTNDMIQEMCILSGCDYLPSLPGMGLKKAYSLISKFKTYEKVIKHLRYSSVAVPPLYEESFKKAVWTFRHQRVYDPNKEDIVTLTNISDSIDGDTDFLGPLMPQQVVKAIAKGDLDPITKLPFQDENVHENSVLHTSSQLKDFRPESNKKLDLPVQKNVLTNYFCFASLEAKRKFRIPRVSPKDSDSGNDSPTLMKQVFGSNKACKADDSPSESLLDQVVQGDDVSSHNSTENGFSQKEFEDNDSPVDGSLGQNPLEQSHRSIHKPCLVLRRGHVDEHGLRTVSEKENLKEQDAAPVKSFSFQHNSVCESDSNCKTNRVTLRRSYFVDKPDEDELLGSGKKVVIKSSYFKHKSKSTRSFVNDKGFVKDNSFIDGDTSEECLPEMAAVGNNYEEDLYIKRKASSSLNPKEHVENKHARTDTYEEAKGADLSADGDKTTDVVPEEEKFGCKISHLGHYSDISGKSIEKFVSVVSSFKFGSSGSRASGLRAPFRDVKNTYPSRTPAATDIGNFSYIPKSTKIKAKRASSQRL